MLGVVDALEVLVLEVVPELATRKVLDPGRLAVAAD